jgi:tripartite-type tricarboxylate transporter receptor subunit TctC
MSGAGLGRQDRSASRDRRHRKSRRRRKQSFGRSAGGADGYTLLLGNSTNQVLNPQLMRSPPFDPAKDFVAVTILTKIPNAMAVHPSLPVHTLKELADYARANAGKLSYGSAGVGTMTHLSGELFKKLAGGLDMVHVPYRGGAPGIADITGGTVPVVSLSMARSLAHPPENSILCAEPRSASSRPDPDRDRSGRRDRRLQRNICPAGTPRPIALHCRRHQEIMIDPGLQKVLKGAGADIVITTPTSTRQRSSLTAERARWTPIIRRRASKKR